MAEKRGKKRDSAEKRPTPTTDEATKVQFHYIKSNYFRVIHADGIFGGATPTGGDLMMNIWSQRAPIPVTVTHSVSSEGKLGPEIQRESKEGIVREVEVGIVFKPEAVRGMILWLQRHLDAAESAQGGGEQ